MKYLTEAEDGGFAISILFGENALPDVRHVPFPDIPDGQAVNSVDFSTSTVVLGAVSESDPLHRDLSPAEFEWLLGYTELDDIWDAMSASLKGSSAEADKLTRAALKSNRRASRFELNKTLVLVAQFRPMAESINPEIDLSDAVIEAAWAAAIGAAT